MNQRARYSISGDQAERHGIDSLVLGLVLGMSILVGGALLNDHQRHRPPVDAVGVPSAGAGQVPVPAIVEHLEPGETLWGLAREYAPTQDPSRWIRRVCELNGWTAVPHLQPYQAFVVVSWKSWPMDIEQRENGELVPIDPYAGDGIGATDGR